jgi:hypothetical protein
MRDFSFPPWCKWDLCSFGILWCVEWFLTMFWDNITVPASRVNQPLKNGTNRLSQNISKKLSFYAAENPKRVLISVLRYKYLILVTYHPDTIFLCAMMWGSVVIFQSQKESMSKKFGKHSSRALCHFIFVQFVFGRCLFWMSVETLPTLTEVFPGLSSGPPWRCWDNTTTSRPQFDAFCILSSSSFTHPIIWHWMAWVTTIIIKLQIQ